MRVVQADPMSQEVVAKYWDDESAAFDDEPDHGLRDPTVRAAWRDLLAEVLPPPPATVADMGCGTGSLSLLLAEDGYDLTGIDISPKMIAAARHKAAHVATAVFFEGDVGDPDLEPASVDVVIVRHVTWALPDPHHALQGWKQLLRPQGRLVLIEGLWSTGAGMTARQLGELVAGVCHDFTTRPLTDERLWGGPIDDERYLLVAQTAV